MNPDGLASQASLPPDAPDLIARIVDDLDRGLDVTMVARAEEGRALLDAVASQLARGRTRVLRVAAASTGGLTLADLLARLHPDMLRPDMPRPAIKGFDQASELGIQALTQLDPSCNRIVLLVSSAETLERNALRAIQLAAEAQPKLRLVFSGTPALLDILEHPDRRRLHERLNQATNPRDGDEDGASALSNAIVAPAGPLRSAPANSADRYYKVVAAGVGVLATVGLIVFIGHAGVETAATTRLPSAQPARADMEFAGSQAANPAQPVSQDPQPTRAVDSDVAAASALALPGSELASIVPPLPIQPLATAPAAQPSAPAAQLSAMAAQPSAIAAQPSAPAAQPLAMAAQPSAVAAQASLFPLLRRREPTPRHVTAPAPRYASRPPASADQPGADQAYADRNGRTVADALPLRLKDRPLDRRADPRPAAHDEPRPQQDGDAWPLHADEPRGTIGIYSGGPGGIRSFRYGS